MAIPNFRFYLVHKNGYQALGASQSQTDGYVMFRLFHPNAQVFDAAGHRKEFQYVGDVPGDEIQTMIESGEWDLAGSNPFD